MALALVGMPTAQLPPEVTGRVLAGGGALMSDTCPPADKTKRLPAAIIEQQRDGATIDLRFAELSGAVSVTVCD